jgi:hypothetical protein
MTTKVTSSVLADTAVSAGTYGGTQTLQAFTVDAQGRVTYAANITSGVITAGTRGQGADIIVPTIQYNALGQIVAATNTTIRTATTSVTGVVQLADSVSNTSTTAAATASAVKAAFDAAAANAATVLTSSQNASNLSSGTVPAARLSGSYTGITGVGTLAAGSVPSSLVSGLASSATTDTTSATNITSGTLPAARLSGSYTGITGVGTLAAGSVPTSLITGLASSATTDTTSATNISSGTLPSARLSGSYTGITGVGTLTSGSLASLAEFGRLITGSGYQKLPGGLILQWGTHNSTGSGYVHGTSYSGTFAIQFPEGSPFLLIPYVSTTAATTVAMTFAKFTSTYGGGYTFQFGSTNGATYVGSMNFIALGY